MGTRTVLHSAAGLLISFILTSHLINVTQGSKVWGEVALPEDLEAEKASVRYPGVTDDEDFAADEASGDLPSGEEDGSTPEPSTVGKTVYFRALVNFTNSFVYTPELENIESEAFREISDAVVDTLESEYNRIAGVQTVNVVVIRKIGDNVFVELDVTSDYNSDSSQIRSVLYSVVEDGSIASYITSVSGFEFRRLGEVVPSTRPCLGSEFTCRDGGCIPQEYFCDKRPDCVDMSDELDCETLSPPEVAPTPPKPLPDRKRPQLPVGGPCRVDQATCQNGECIPRDYLCDGERDCTDGSDEIKCGTPSPCEPNEFKCQNGRCALKLWRCDGDNDCGDNSDESYCPTKGPQDTCAPEQFMCVRDRTCIPASYQCDEEADCADRSDEYDCSPPSVTRPPEESIKAQRGQTVTFTCTAVGVPTPIISWRLNWGHIPTSSRITVTSENGYGTLTIRDVKEGDQGAYTCEAINAKGMVFAIPDGVLSLVQSTGNCPSGHFSVEGSSRCIPCFCFGITKSCQNTGRYRNQIRLRFTEEDDFKGVNVSYPSRPGTPPLSSTQLLINPEMEEFQLVDLSRRFLVLESYWTLPRQFLGNKIDSYGGSLQYKVRYVLARGLSDPEEKSDVILVGNGQRLIYRRTKPTPPTVTNQKEVKFTEENWQHSSGLPVTREDLMMTLVNLESINIRTIYDNHMVSVALSDIIMDTSTVEYSIQGPAQIVEECRCPAGYSGLSCETCSPGFDRVSGGSFLGTCAGCNCNGHASDCDPVSGHCLRCQHNTEGAQCDKCRPGYFGDPRRGRPDDCKPCPCPYPETSRRFSDTCYLDQDNQATCDACRPGYTGRRCESCAPGYQGNPLQPNGKCVPSASSKCDSRGTVSPTGSRPCACKPSVVGALCDECKTGSFHLTEANPEGCLQCFCMGVTKQCASSSWSRDQVRGGVNGQLFALSNGANTRTITQGVIQKSSSEVAFRSFAEVPSDIYYWVLPENFRGDKVTAYGGELRYTVRYEPRFRSLVIDGQPDVILQGNGIFLEHFSKTKPLPRIPATITVSFREGAWRRADGQPCTRQHLIMALADISVFMIRASYADNMAESSLSDIRMDIAVPHSTGQERALEVEECACPQGYRGPSCQECDVGYSRTGSGLYLGTCERCSCYGHASRCDPETGDCVQCQHNTVGPRCDRCASGYYGDPKTGGAAACQRCPCPGTSPGNQFSQTCYLASDGQPTCESCPPGYTGRRCERCAAGYIGNPLQGQACTFGNNDLNGNCQHCDRSGTERCDGNRICRCKAHVEGTSCSSCKPGNFHLSAEHPEGCLKCFCMGVTQQCSSSNYYRDTVSIAFSPGNFQDMALVNRQRTNRITTGFTVEVSTDGTQLSFSNFGNLEQEAHFWQLPEVFRGDKREAYYARMRRAHKKDSPWTEEQLRKDASIWKLMDSMGEKSSRSKRAVKSSAEIQKLDDEIWALISNFSKDPPPPPSQPIPSSLSSNRLPPPSGLSSSSTRLPGSYYAPPEYPSHYSRPQARPQAQRGPNVVSLHGARPGSRGKYALVYKGFSLHPEDVLFWQLPPQFRGDKVGSYGGTLRYTISYVAGQRGTPIEDADVQLIGNDITLVSHQRWQRGQGARESRQFEVAFKEEHWRRPDGMPATREHLMMVLADLDDILIRASYYTDMLSASISDIRMEVSVPNYSGLAQALEVEQCRCPPGYQGLSCQDCAPGYSRTGGGLYLGHCELCECNGHSDTCHPETGVCTTCLHNTMGELCEQCAPGYFGDPTAGTPEDCQKCACPHMDPDYQFSPTCESTGNGGYRCTACQPGYTGQYCERCAPGYEGDPQRRVRCRPSNNAASLVVRVHPERVLVAQGNPVMLRCQVTGSPPHYFHWSREDRRPISSQAERRRQGEELYFPSIEPSDAGVYICTCRDQRSSNTSRAEIVVTTVARPIEVTVEEPKAQSVTVGSTVSFICTAKSQSPAYTLVWTRQGNRKLPHRAMDFNGILTIQNVQPDDAGVYVCTGSNMFAMDEGTAVLYVPEASQTQMFYTAYEMFEGHRTPSEGSQAIATVHPPVLTIQQGQRAEFRCTATGNPPPTVEWIVGHGNQISPHAVIRGGVLTITKVERSDEGEYICKASNTHGEHNARAVLYVHSASLPHVQVSPQRVQVNEGETLRLYCRAGGTPSPGLTWKKKGGQLPPQAIPSHGFHQFKSNSVDVLQRRIEELQARMERTDIGTLLIPNVRATDAGTYLCVGTNSLGSSEAPIEVSVASAEPFSTAVSIRPPVAAVQEGQTLDLSCIIPGAPPVSVSWIRVGGHLPANHQVLGTQLRILNASPEDSGEYICRVDGGPTVRQASVTVTVTPRSPLEPVSHTVSIRPTVAIVRVGQPLELNCLIPGKTSASVTWIRVGGHLLRNHQVSGTRLRILNPSFEDSGEYVCRVDGEPRLRQASVTVSVVPRTSVEPSTHPVSIQLSTSTVREGQPLELTCVVPGTTPRSVTWIRVGGDLPRNHQVSGNRLRILNASPEDSGEYICRVDDRPTVRQASITVTIAPRSPLEPFSHSVSIRPSTATIREGQPLELDCVVPGSTPRSVTWIRVGGHLPRNHQVLGTRLRILNLSPEDSGEYVCRVDDGRTVQQGSVTVSVTPRSSLEPLLHGVGIRPSTATVQLGQPLELNCVIPGSTPTSVTWIRVGGDLPRNHQVLGTRLRILNPSPEDSGEYVCRVGDGPRVQQGSVIVSVTPSSSVEPFLHGVGIRPSLATVQLGQPLELNCVIPGSTPTSVTWIRVGGDLPRNHQVLGTLLRILNPSPEDSGEYVCRVDDGPRVQQGSVTVSVTPSSSVEPFLHGVGIRPSTATVQLGQPLELNCVIPGSTPTSVTWIRVGGDLPRNHQVLGTRLRILNPSPEDSGEYVCRVDDGPRVQQGSVTVSVTPSSSVEPFLHGVGIRPSTATVQLGQPLELNCVIPGSTPTSVTWIRVGGDLPRNHQVLGTRLRILNPSPEDSGEYVCRVDDGPRVQQGSVTVSVTPSSSVEPLLHGVGIRPSTATVQVGQPLELNCVIPGSTPTSVTWIRVGGDLPRNHQVLGTRLRILNPSPEDSGEYVCRVDDGPGVQQGSVTVSVTPSSSVEPFLHRVGIRPSTTTVQEGRPLELNCVIPGSTPTSVTWIRVGGDLPRNHQVLGTLLRIFDPSPEDSGEYICRVDDGRTVQQGSVTVTVTPRSSVEPLLHGVGIRPSTASVQEGQPLELNCVIPGSTPTSVTWIRVGGDLPRNHQVLGTRLRILNPSPEDSGEYICRADDGPRVQQGSVTVSVTPSSSVEPFSHGVDVRPSTATVQEGHPLELTCVVPGGTPTSVTWIRMGGDLPRNHQIMLQVAGSRLWIPNTSPEDSGEYICRVEGRPTVQQASVTVTVAPRTTLEPLSHPVSIRPSVASVHEGQPLELDCVVPGSSPRSVTWIRVGGHLPPNHQVLGTRLRILNPSPEDSGEYVCRVDDGRTARQGSVSVSVTPSSSVLPTSNGVSIRPSNATVQEGQPLELDCVIPGKPPISVTWIRVGGDLPSNHQVLGTQLRILNASPADTGKYFCRVDDGSTVRQASVAVAVTPSSSTASSARLPTPTISIEPHRADVRQGDSASFRCRVHTGVRPVRLEWKLPNNRPMPDNVRVSPDGAVIIISNAQPSDQGTYRCVASNAFGMTHSIVSLIVRVPESPKAVVTPQGLVRVRVGEPINLECQGSGEPRPSVSWHRLDSGRRTVLTSPVPMDSNAVMQVLAARPEDSGTYICTVRNSEGLTEVAVEVRVEGEELAPSAPRASVPEPLQVVEEGETATLRCHAYGHPTPTITWSKLRAPLPWRHRVVNNTLILPGVARQDSGQYICNATNSLGTSEVTVMLDVETPPYATCLPDDLAVRVGEVIRLQCLSHGTPPLRFQWTKVNGSLSSRAEVDDGNLQINLATAADAGTYKCVVSNKVGSSEALAKVAVRSPLSVRVWPQVEVKAIGSAVEFTCSAAGGIQTTIEWIKEGGPMPVNHHINEGVLRIENLEQSDEGVYICRATGVYGQAQDTAKLTIQALPKVMINIRTSVQTVMIGNSVEFECHATGDPQPSVRWSKVGGELPAHVVVQGGMLKIERVEEADAGQYRCTATNNVGSVQSEVVLNVQSLPQIVSPPDEKEVNLGSGAVFPCVATGYPVPEIKWSKLDGELSSAAVVEGNVLTIPSVKQEDAGTYVCTASNKQGMVQAFTKLKVHERVMPHFTQTPLSYLTLPTIKNSYKAFNIKINFRPDSADGVILYAGMIIYNGQKRKTGADFVSLGLVGGRPEFRFDVGSGMATLRYPTPITLGEFHTVELHRNLTLGSIVVDGHPPVNGSSQGKFQGLDLNEELFVGGYPNYTAITKKTGLKTGFIGCIRQLIIQGEEVVFKDLDQNSIGVSNCPSCKDRPCQHGGVCEDSETSIYRCSCPWGYTGSNCEHHSSQHCHPEACGADATCINRPSGLGYDCRCHLGKSGDKCTQGTLVTIPHFDGEDSFIAYPPLTNIHNDLRVEVEFKPLDPDGLMFFSGGKKMKVEDFVALSMVDGHVEFRYELGTGMAILRSREPITIGQWHHVVAERLNKDGFLKVDQDREVRRSSPGKAQGLNIHTPMYLGGVPSMDILPKPANVSMLFEGCVGEVSINGKKVDLSYSFTESRAISQCVDTNPCDRRPCLHGGSCLASAEYEYQCLCLDGFEGDRCEVVKHVCQVDAQCKNGGKCADGQCVCPGGFSGLYCEHAYAAQARSILDTLWNTEGSGGNDAPAQHAAYFHDDGYLALPKSIFPRSSPDAPETIELEIRSTTSDGLILWQGVHAIYFFVTQTHLPSLQEPSDGLRRLHAGTQELGEEGRGKDYISLGLQSGHLVFSYQLGSGEAEIFSEEPINDGKWHKITAVRTGRLGYVQVDGGAISRGQSQGSSIMVNTKGNVFLGGAPDITALTGSRFSSGITGCVKNLELVNARPGEQPARHIDLQAHAQEGINVERCSS